MAALCSFNASRLRINAISIRLPGVSEQSASRLAWRVLANIREGFGLSRRSAGLMFTNPAPVYVASIGEAQSTHQVTAMIARNSLAACFPLSRVHSRPAPHLLRLAGARNHSHAKPIDGVLRPILHVKLQQLDPCLQIRRTNKHFLAGEVQRFHDHRLEVDPVAVARIWNSVHAMSFFRSSLSTGPG